MARFFLALFFVLPLMAFADQGERKANAEELLNDAQRALGSVVQTARQDPALNPRNSQAKLFWEGLKDLNRSLDKAQTSLALQSDPFFSALANAQSHFAQADVALFMADNTRPETNHQMQQLQKILTTLAENYSKAAARLKQGGQLTPAEQSQLARLQKEQKKLLKRLDKVEKKAAKQNAKLKQGIKKLREKSKRMANQPANVGGFVGGIFLGHFIFDWLWAWHWWWGPWGGWCPGFIVVNVGIWDEWHLDYDYDWDLVELEVDVSDLDLDTLAVDDFALEESDAYLETSDFELESGELAELSTELGLGYDLVDSDFGSELQQGAESNFDQGELYQPEADLELETFDDMQLMDMGF